MLSVNPPTQCSGTPSDTRLSVNPFVVALPPRPAGAPAPDPAGLPPWTQEGSLCLALAL